ncbi:5-methyltetrahydropteroyltriglutamate--homocysteine methyltransferase [Roseomonas sp. CCTCC AB2023176]|uniref:5-methyltetrahydropteroyltriglutamate-- homocysteine methyltransferase n=1 Tax=Roseomonas sp. CCTCC AB2023176 TaxID=3342640 RepID=UPI0035E29218
MNTLLPTTVVGSYPQPDWLVDRSALAKNLVPRIRMASMWRPAPDVLEGAQDDATILAIRDMERAGVDIITDGEARRESYSNRFALSLEGIDHENPARVMGRAGRETLIPRVVGPIRRIGPVELRDAQFLIANTDRRTKITLPGPFTMSQQAHDEHYGDEEAMAMAYAEAVNAEARDLFAAGVDVVQIDEPWMQARPEQASRYGVRVLNRALEGLTGTTVVHLCFGYAAIVKDKPAGYTFLPALADCGADQISIEAAQPRLDLGVLRDFRHKTIMLGVLDLGAEEVETPETVAGRIRAAFAHLPPEQVVPAPDCGMKYMPRERAFGKLKAMAQGAAIVRRELTGQA